MNRRICRTLSLIGVCAVSSVAEGQLTLEAGGIKVQTSSPFQLSSPQEFFNAAAKASARRNEPFEDPFTPESAKPQADPNEIVQLSETVTQELVVPSPVPPTVEDVGVIVDDDDDEDEEEHPRSMWELANSPYSGYRSERQEFSWLPGSGDDFGILDWASDPYLAHDSSTGLTSAFNIHWLSGPTTAPVQSRVFDFIGGFQTRGHMSRALSYDLAATVGVYSDFEGSARDGVRFPAHAVGMLHMSHGIDFVFGADYLDRDDISLLPVVGFSFRNVLMHGLRMDLVFPRPRIQLTLDDTHRIYVGGELGGGTWDVELQGIEHTVMTYRDYRVVLGFESADDDGGLSSLEFGYVFDRNLEFRGMTNNLSIGDAFMIRLVSMD